ncbi:unnamed protein product [marine sediment metagenome]|uniref:Phage protein n=1 Tax=marine sediment metagenome TaxID=412755 RepID=X0WUQ4_9ZZZZ
MSFMDAFKTEMNQTITINKKDRVYNEVNSQWTEAVSLRIAVQGLFYEGRAAENFVSEKFKAKIDGVVIVDPVDIADVTLNDSDNIVIGSRNFTVVHADNVALQNEATVIAIKEVK